MSILRKVTAVAALSLAFIATASDSRADEKEIKVGTLAPKSSVWGKVFQVWQDEVSSQSKGDLKLTFFWNGSQGDEGAMVDKMKTGQQLDAAAITSIGLSKIWRPILALQMPGLFRSWGALDRARAAMTTETNAAFTAAGFTNLGFGDVGISHTMSKGFAIHGPDDLKGKSPWMSDNDVILPVLYRIVGGVTPKPMGVPAVLPALNAGTIDVVEAPALAASQLQWASKLDHIVGDPSGCAIGALVIKNATLQSLTADQQKLITDTGGVAAAGLTDRIRKADANAFENLKGKMETSTLTDDEKTKWEDVFKRTRDALKQGVFDPALVAKLEGMRG